MAKKQKQEQTTVDDATKFANLRGAIEEMYQTDAGVKNNVNVSSLGSAASISSTTTISSVKSTFFNAQNVAQTRSLSLDAYAFYPQYRAIIDSLVNAFYWRYTYVPRMIKPNAKGDYAEIYALMAEVVDGLSLETAVPTILTSLLLEGQVFVYGWKRNSSKTITTIFLPAKYCRATTQTQFGTRIYQFNMAYFDDLSLSADQLEQAWNFYPPEMRALYEAYKADRANCQWPTLNPRFAAAFMLNSRGIPTYLHSLMSVLRYNQYQDNELEHSNQQLERIITHQMPVWQDQLVVQVPEMKALHKGMATALSTNKHVRLLTSFGTMGMLSIGRDQSKENKTLAAAQEAIYHDAGLNANLYSSDTKEAIEAMLRTNESIIWHFVQQVMSFFAIAVNNSFNFKGYQCDLTMLPLSVNNFSNQLLQYKEGATLGVSKLEYIVALGVKQIDIAAKVALEDFLQLDQLKPLNTSYTQTQGANASGIVTDTDSSSTADIDGSAAEEETPAPQEESNTSEI